MRKVSDVYVVIVYLLRYANVCYSQVYRRLLCAVLFIVFVIVHMVEAYFGLEW